MYIDAKKYTPLHWSLVLGTREHYIPVIEYIRLDLGPKDITN